MVSRLEHEWAKRYPSHSSGEWKCTATTSGTAAIHCAVAAIDPEPGDEIITTAITDMGAITPILYQSAVPVFADVDPYTFNVTAESIARVITARTKAIIVTHLFGVPCDMPAILELATRQNLPIIEDAAQAPFALSQGQRVGTVGSIGCFSLQQGKHMACGEGGLVITRDAALARHMTLFHDKAWGYGDPQPDHYFLALNYRMTELQGAVALAQLEKVQDVVSARQEGAARFTDLIRDLPGVVPQRVPQGATSVFWKFVVRVDEKQTGADVGQIAGFLRQHYGISSVPRYVQKPAFMCEIFQKQRTFGTSRFPFVGAHRQNASEAEYSLEEFPGTVDALAHMLVVPWNENYTEEHVQYIARALREAVHYFRHQK
jgi:dTDP-4-amino-4,6-dideoxygalactose transaminase